MPQNFYRNITYICIYIRRSIQLSWFKAWSFKLTLYFLRGVDSTPTFNNFYSFILQKAKSETVVALILVSYVLLSLFNFLNFFFRQKHSVFIIFINIYRASFTPLYSKKLKAKTVVALILLSYILLSLFNFLNFFFGKKFSFYYIY